LGETAGLLALREEHHLEGKRGRVWETACQQMLTPAARSLRREVEKAGWTDSGYDSKKKKREANLRARGAAQFGGWRKEG